MAMFGNVTGECLRQILKDQFSHFTTRLLASLPFFDQRLAAVTLGTVGRWPVGGGLWVLWDLMTA
jgi:hypothetical protein